MNKERVDTPGNPLKSMSLPHKTGIFVICSVIPPSSDKLIFDKKRL
jgi:hypothetical protein